MSSSLAANPSPRPAGDVTDPSELDAATASRLIASGDLTSETLVQACLDRIAARESDTHAWVYLDPQAALAQARARDAEPSRGPLHGIPVGVKDLIDTADMPTGYGSAIYDGWQPKADAAAITLLKRAGAVIMGKAVTQAFGCGIPIEVNNGLDPNFTAGGSSSGSTAAVAARMVPLALGSQSASSLIRPSSYNGVVGMRPSFGVMSLAGFKYFNASFDTLGLIARTVQDVAMLWQVQVSIPISPVAASAPPRIGLCRTPWWSYAEPATRAAVEGAAALMERHGATVTEFELPPEFADLHEAHKAMQTFEAAHSYAWEYDNHRDLLDAAVLGHIEKGLSLGYDRYLALLRGAQAARTTFAALMEPFDALLAPSAPGEPPPSRRVAGENFVMGDPVMSRGWTLLHVPCITLPHFEGPQGMPVGVQLVGAFGEDQPLLRHAAWAEQVFLQA